MGQSHLASWEGGGFGKHQEAGFWFLKVKSQ
jgi:hypothetical protein